MSNRCKDSVAASILIVVGATQFLLFMHVAEFLYPGYSVSSNYISDLGATCRSSGCVIYQPSSLIFNSSIILLGILILASSIYIHRVFRSIVLTILLILTGAGSVGVGVFPETYGLIHTISSIITFIPASLLPLATIFVIKDLFHRIYSTTMTIISLISLILFVARIDIGLGVGGLERMIVYPILFWALFFGGLVARICSKSSGE